MAACSSITSSRLARLTPGDQFALDGRRRQPFVPQAIGSWSALQIARECPGRLRAWPSLPSMLIGRPSTKPTALRSAASASKRVGVGVKTLRQSSRRRWRRGGPGRRPPRRWFWCRDRARSGTSCGQESGGFDQREDRGGHGKRIPCVPQHRQSRMRPGIPSDATPPCKIALTGSRPRSSFAARNAQERLASSRYDFVARSGRHAKPCSALY